MPAALVNTYAFDIVNHSQIGTSIACSARIVADRLLRRARSGTLDSFGGVCMFKLLRRVVGLAFAGFAPLVAANPCVSGSLQDYIDLLAGCEVGATTFANFFVAPGQSGATPIDPTLIDVAPGGSVSDPALVFTFDANAVGVELFEAFFHYSVAAGAGVALNGASLALSGASASGLGAVTAVQDLCLDGTFQGGVPLDCTGTPLTLIAFAIDGDSGNDSALFANASLVDVFVDFVVDGGLFGAAALGSGTSQYATTASTPVPEPPTLSLILLALAAAAGLGRRTRSAA
ncbi:MAG: PEP-CTERM sorting domain-containing protein [Burkholderiales bacterium]|nr:PEP-CTERM sorting domain-containing protein [Burkholderiales bacterium]